MREVEGCEENIVEFEHEVTSIEVVMYRTMVAARVLSRELTSRKMKYLEPLP